MPAFSKNQGVGSFGAGGSGVEFCRANCKEAWSRVSRAKSVLCKGNSMPSGSACIPCWLVLMYQLCKDRTIAAYQYITVQFWDDPHSVRERLSPYANRNEFRTVFADIAVDTLHPQSFWGERAFCFTDESPPTPCVNEGLNLLYVQGYADTEPSGFGHGRGRSYRYTSQ